MISLTLKKKGGENEENKNYEKKSVDTREGKR